MNTHRCTKVLLWIILLHYQTIIIKNPKQYCWFSPAKYVMKGYFAQTVCTGNFCDDLEYVPRVSRTSNRECNKGSPPTAVAKCAVLHAHAMPRVFNNAPCHILQVKPRKHVKRDMVKIREKRNRDAGGIFLGERKLFLILHYILIHFFIHHQDQ